MNIKFEKDNNLILIDKDEKKSKHHKLIRLKGALAALYVLSSGNNLTFDEIIALMAEKDFDDNPVIISRAHPASEEGFYEAQEQLNKSTQYLKAINKRQSIIPNHLSCK